MEALNERVHKLSRTVSRVQRDSQQRVEDAPVVAEARAEQGPVEQQAPEQPPASKPAITDQDVQTGLSAGFQSEVVDTTWAPAAARTIQGDFSRALSANSSIESVECRQSLCRIQTVHSDVDTYRTFAYGALTSAANEWSGARYMHLQETLPDGRVRSVAYAAREGADLMAFVDAEQNE
jgi:hypothetical protein